MSSVWLALLLGSVVCSSLTGAAPAGTGPQGVWLPLCQGRLLGAHAAGCQLPPAGEAAPQGRAGTLFPQNPLWGVPHRGLGENTLESQPLP